MILKGNQRANGQELAQHLLNAMDNEHVTLHELRGFLASDLADALKESEAISLGTKCQQYLFSLSLNPPQTAKVSVAEFEAAIADIERRMGLSGQPRAIVFHEKKGRRHAHCVWSRINTAKMRAINLPHFKRRLMDISRELYLEHGWEMPAGLRRAEDRNPNAYSHDEAGQANRTKRDPQRLKAMFKSCWAASDSRTSFAAALWEQGFCLARGDRRGFVAVDGQGEIYSLSRWCGVKIKELRSRIGDGADLPDVAAARALLDENIGPSFQDTREQDGVFDAKQDMFAQELTDLIARQRKERQTLDEAQNARRIKELIARHSTMPTGIRAAWARLTGHYQRLCDDAAAQAQACAMRDQLESQALVDRHLAERKSLERKVSFSDVQRALRDEFLGSAVNGRSMSYALDPRQPLILPRDTAPFTVAQLKAQPDLILAHLNDKQARFTRTDILRGLAGHISDPFDLRIASDLALASPELVQVKNDEGAEYTTRDFLEVTEALTTCTSEMAGSGGFKVNTSYVEQAIKRENTRLQKQIGASLSEEQVTAIRHILNPHQMSAVVGLAGAGKSTMLSVARVAWERQGYRVHGAALAGKAADSLQNASGIPSRTLASMEACWKSGYEPVGCSDIVVVDEAGMVGTRQLSRVTEQLRQRGCKLVLIGDPDQLQPIEAGTPFRDVVDAIGAASLSEIRRQTSGWQRRASEALAKGRTSEVLQSYASHGAVRDTRDRDHAIAALVDDYVADWHKNGDASSRLALAHRRVDVHAINQGIKAARANDDQPQTFFETDHGPRAFAEGDRILFTRNDATLGVRNGMLGTVETTGDDKLAIRFDVDGTGKQRQLRFSPSQFTAFDHGFAVSIHRSQGCTVDRSFVLSSRSLDKHLAYVALTRHRGETGFYTVPDIQHTRGQERRNRRSSKMFKARPQTRPR